MLLYLTTDKISLITSETCDVDVVAQFIDRNQTTGAVGEANRQSTTIATGTTTDIVASPVATTTRKINHLTIRNAHATTSVDVTVQFNANGTLYELYGGRLYPTEALEFTVDKGFKKLERSRMSPFFAVNTYDGQQNSLTSTITLVAGCQKRTPASLTAKTYGFFSSWNYLSAATTTGFKPFIGSLGSAGTFGITSGIFTAVNNVTAATLMSLSGTAGQLLAFGTTPVATSFGVMAGAHNFPIQLEGATRDYVLAFASEVGASLVTCNAGTWLDVFEVTR